MMSTLRSLTQTLAIKLAVAFLLVALAGVAVVSFLANQATTVGFRHFLDADAGQEWSPVQAALAEYYAQQGEWGGVEVVLTAVPSRQGQGNQSLVLLDEKQQIVAESGGVRNRPTTSNEADLNLPIEVDGRQVGTLLVGIPGMGNSRAAEEFLANVNRAILWGGLAATFLALFLGVLLSYRLTRPLHQLTQATEQMASGKLSQQVNVNSRDELGKLATSFNQMATALESAEQQRQQLLADVAHELRTPLSITRSHIEAMLDGVHEMTVENLGIVHEETILLGRLIEDLRTLSLAEAGRLPLDRAAVNLGDLAKQAVAAFAPLAEAESVQLTADIPPNLPLVIADRDRIQQLFGNLLANALRHAVKDTPRVHLEITTQGDFVQTSISDNGPGLSAIEQQHVFDRFWRADNARSREQGGSGLGLAICRAIVAAHDGHIGLESQPGHGATFTFTLPAISE